MSSGSSAGAGYDFLPYPIAVHASRASGASLASEQLGALIRTVDSTLRFLLLVELAHRAPRSSDVEIDSWLKALVAPGLGKFRHVLKALTKSTGATPFVSESVEIDDAWTEDLDALVLERNQHAHDRVQVSDATAAEILAKCLPAYDRFVDQVAFLRHYAFGHAHCRPEARGQYSLRWTPCTGAAEWRSTVHLALKGPFRDHVAALIDLRTRRALVLEPYFSWEPDLEIGESNVRWLKHFDQETGAATMCRPAGGGMLQGLRSPDRMKRLDRSGYRAVRDRYDGALTLEIDPEHLETVRHSVPAHRYETIRRIGSGGMGVVWEARDTIKRTRVAVKRIDPTLRHQADALARFRREADTLIALSQRQDPRIVECLEYFVDEQGPAIVMTLVEGEDLATRLQRMGPVPLDEAIDHVETVLEALGIIHGEKIIHGDIKPANLIFTNKGLRVVDFGIARHGARRLATNTRAGLGTPRYVAPETLSGTPTFASDLFSAGRVLFALLVGREPVHDNESLREACQHAPAYLDEAYRRATERKPQDRYASAREMAEALRPRPTAPPAPVTGRTWPAASERFGAYALLESVGRSDHEVRVFRARRSGMLAAPPVWMRLAALDEVEDIRDSALGREFVLLANTTHPALPHLEDAVVERGCVGLAVTAIESCRLSELLKGRGGLAIPLPVNAAILIAMRVSSALEAIHTASQQDDTPLSFRHGAVWPPSIHVGRHGEVQLHGLEHLEPEGSSSEPLRALDSRSRYLAPEVAQGGAATSASDAYSVGIILWEMLARRPVFHGLQNGALVDAIRGARHSPIPDHPAIGGEIRELVAALLSADPRSRPRVGEFGRQLAAIASLNLVQAELELARAVRDYRAGIASRRQIDAYSPVRSTRE